MEGKETLRTPAGELEIRSVQDTDSIEELTGLLHRAYKVLADMGLRFVATYQTPEVTRRRLERGLGLVGLIEGRVVATITYYSPRNTGGTPWYNRSDVAYFGQFAVEPEFQGCGIGGHLLHAVERIALQEGVAELALDTSEKAEHLIAYYQRKGYRPIEYHQWDVTNYRSVVMSKQLAGSKPEG